MTRIWMFGDDVDTDQILPGRYAPYMTSEAELSKYPFIEARPEFAGQVVRGDVIVAGKNFGCGSSREYAPRALYMVGLGAVIAPSFSRIFYRNALNLGLPLFEADLTDQVSDGDEAVLILDRFELLVGDRCIALPAPAPWVREVWENGGILAYYARYGRFPVGERTCHTTSA